MKKSFKELFNSSTYLNLLNRKVQQFPLKNVSENLSMNVHFCLLNLFSFTYNDDISNIYLLYVGSMTVCYVKIHAKVVSFLKYLMQKMSS